MSSCQVNKSLKKFSESNIIDSENNIITDQYSELYIKDTINKVISQDNKLDQEDIPFVTIQNGKVIVDQDLLENLDLIRMSVPQILAKNKIKVGDYTNVKNLNRDLIKILNLPKNLTLVGSTEKGFKIDNKLIYKLLNERFNNLVRDKQQKEDFLDSKNAFFFKDEISIEENMKKLAIYNKEQVNKITSEIKKLNIQKNNSTRPSDKKGITDRIRYLSQIRKRLNNQIANLDTNEDNLSSNLENVLIQKLNNLLEDFHKTDFYSLKELKNQRDFLYEFITGKTIDHQRPSDTFGGIGEISETLNKLLTESIDKYNKVSDDFIKKQLEEDTHYQDLIENIKKDNPNKTQVEIQEIINSLFEANTDISFFDKMFLGVNSSAFSWDTIYPQLMYKSLSREIHKEELIVNKLKNNLKKALNGRKNIDFVKEIDENGDITGNVLDVFTSKWATELGNIQKLMDSFKYAQNAKDKNDFYKAVLNKIQRVSDIVDIRKLKVFRNNYGNHEEIGHYFKFSEEEMDSYEEDLINRVGKEKLEEIYQSLESQIEFYLDNKENSTSEYYAASLNIFGLLEAIENNSEDPYINYIDNNGDEKTLRYIDFENLMFIPKENLQYYDMYQDSMSEQESGFYSQQYKNLTSEERNILSAYRKSVEYINATYSLDQYNTMTLPKVMRDFNEKVAENFSNRKFKKIGADFLQEWKALYYETGRFKIPGSEIKANYRDNSENEIRELAKNYMFKGMSQEEAYSKAKKEVYARYSEDTLRDVEAILNLSVLQRGRQNAEPIVNTYMEKLRSIKAGNTNQELSSLIKKQEDWINRRIYGIEDKERGSGKALDKSWFTSNTSKKIFEAIGTIPVLGKFVNEKTPKLLNEVEKELYNELMELKEKGFNGKEKISFSLDDVKYEFKPISIETEGVEIYTAYDIGGATRLTKKEFDEAFQKYVDKKIDDLGLDLTTSGIAVGLMKSLVIKSLGFNVVSGLTNSVEGKTTFTMMDRTGNYWTPGNGDKANTWVMGLNTLLFTNKHNFTNIGFKEKRQRFESYKTFMQTLNLVQDKKNVFDAQAENSKYDIGIGLYTWSVDNPEFNIQTTTALAVAQDFEITITNGDRAGEKVKLVDENGNFTFFDLVNGEMVLKPEFIDEANGILDIADFLNTDTIFKYKELTKQAISKTQGNYDDNDVIGLTKSTWGKLAATFTKWRYEHIAQRFHTGKGYDLTTGKKRARGRYMHLWDNTGASVLAGSLLVGTTFGFGLPLVLGAGGAGLASLVVRKYFKDTFAGQLENEAGFLQSFVSMFAQTLLETLNMPLRLLNVNGKLRVERLLGHKEITPLAFKNMLKNGNITMEQANNLAAAAREVATKLIFIKLLLLAKALTWDDDDEKESERRMFYNFLDNRINFFINSIEAYHNPVAFMRDVSRFAVFEYMLDVYKFLGIFTGNEEASKDPFKKILNLTPMPRILYKGRMPFYDKVEFDKLPANKLGYTNWIDQEFKETTTKYKWKQYQDKAKEEIKQRLLNEGFEEGTEEFDKALKRGVRNKRLTKPKGVSFKEIEKDLEDLSNGISVDEIKYRRKNEKNIDTESEDEE